jgi:hypothetical protein
VHQREGDDRDDGTGCVEQELADQLRPKLRPGINAVVAHQEPVIVPRLLCDLSFGQCSRSRFSARDRYVPLTKYVSRTPVSFAKLCAEPHHVGVDAECQRQQVPSPGMLLNAPPPGSGIRIAFAATVATDRPARKCNAQTPVIQVRVAAVCPHASGGQI